ncbi:MAG: methyl-accepting chemotaxis protein [Planctomycetota bacterium]
MTRLKTADGTILTANDNFIAAVGYSLEEIQGKHHRIFVDPEHANSAEYKQFWTDLAKGEFKSGEFHRIAKDGTEIWIQASYNPILDPNGKPYKVVKFASDITEAKRRSADQQGQLDAIGKSQAVIEFDLDGIIRHANQNFLDAVGYSLEEIQGKHHRLFVSDEYGSSDAYRQFWADLAKGEFKSGEFQRVAKDGSLIWIQASYNPIFDPSGRPYKVVKFASDITEAKNLAQEIEEAQQRDIERAATARQQVEEILEVVTSVATGDYSKEITVSGDDAIGNLATGLKEFFAQKRVSDAEVARISSMMEQAPTNIMFADMDFVVQYMNPASLKTLRSIEAHLPLRADEIIGQCIDIFHASPSHQRAILADPSNLPMRSEIKIGPETLDLLVSPVRDQNDAHVGAMVTWEVITQKLRLEREVQEKADRERDEAQETQRKVDVVLDVVNAVADGRFDVDIPDLGEGAIGQVATALARAVASMRDALAEVHTVSSTVAHAATEMSGASEEISRGAQQQASRLEETASNLEEIMTTVKQNSDNAQEARALANGSRDVATEGGEVVGDAVQAMLEINEASNKISDIITTIDEIAFQTNLLALNAAVEAARAGEQGRGFAVVASEVRNLAQRSASSAKEIKSLIQDSASKVEKGTSLVNQSGETLGNIVDSVKRVTDIVEEIAAASQEQLSAIEQVTSAVTQMDQVTQANANQTEELTGTSSAVRNHAQRLEKLVGHFDLGLSEGDSRRDEPFAERGRPMAHPTSRLDKTDDDDFLDF